jgi:hypothetical protein
MCATTACASSWIPVDSLLACLPAQCIQGWMVFSSVILLFMFGFIYMEYAMPCRLGYGSGWISLLFEAFGQPRLDKALTSWIRRAGKSL